MKRRRAMKTIIFSLFMLVTILGVFLLNSQIASAQYPTKPIMFMVPAGAGGGWDTTARIAAAVMQKEKIIPQPLQVFNREGAFGTAGMTELIQQNRKNPYMIMITSPPILLGELSGITQYGYKDVTPIANLTTDYIILAVKDDSTFKSFKDMIDVLKKNPLSVKFCGGSAYGSMNHLPLLYVLHAAGIDIKQPLSYLGFPGDGKALTTLMGGHVDVASISLGPSMSYLESKKIRALAILSEKRIQGEFSKDIPTAKELGADAAYPIWRGVMGPPDMPDYALKYLQNAFGKMVETNSWKEELVKKQWLDSFDTTGFKPFLAKELEKNRMLLGMVGLLKIKQ